MASTAGYLGSGSGFGFGFASSSFLYTHLSPTSSTSSSSEASSSTMPANTSTNVNLGAARISKRKLAHPQKAPPSLGYADEEQERLALQPRYMDLSLSLHSASAGIVWSTTCPSPGRRVVQAKHVKRLVEDTERESRKASARLARSKRERNPTAGLGFGYDISPAAAAATTAKVKRLGATPFFGTSAIATLPDSPSSSLPRNTATPPAVPAQASAPPSRRSSVAPATLYARPMVRRSSSRGGGAVALSRSNSTDSLASASSAANQAQTATPTPPAGMAMARRGRAPVALRGASPLPLAMSTLCASPSPTDSAFSSSAVEDALYAAVQGTSSSSKRLLQAHHRLEQTVSGPEAADSDVYEDEEDTVDDDDDQDDGDYRAPRRPRATKKTKLALSDAAAVEAVPTARPQRASRSTRQSPDAMPPSASSLMDAPRPTVKITRPVPATASTSAAAPRPLTLTLSLSGAGPGSSQHAAVARASSRAPRLHSPLSQTFPAAPIEAAQHQHHRAAGVV